MTTVLIADDQDLVRSGLRLILELADLDVVGEAGDGAEAVELAAQLRPDVILMDVRMPRMDGIEATRRIVASGSPSKVLILMDVRMPRMDGIEATRRIVASGSPSKVLILTTFDLDKHVFDALAAGASAFLLKDVGREQLVGAVRTVAAGEALFAPSVLRRLVDHYVARPVRAPQPLPGVDELTARELEILRLIGRGLSNTEIAEELVISLPTVKTHVRHVFQKLGLRDRVQAVVVAYESGLVERFA